MKRRNFISLTTGVAVALSKNSYAAVASKSADSAGGLPIEELTIDLIQSSFSTGRLTAQSLTQAYLERIRALDSKTVNAVIELNPDALAIAAALDAERKTKGPRGPMHGVPVLIKDNIDTAGKMMTTAGSLALDGVIASQDSAVAARLRQAGAVILGKTNLSEWANFRSNHSISGWSGRGGQTRNPFALDRNPSGSSAGTGAGISANFAAVGVGTETDGSIVSPSSCNGLVGIKPTVGLIARSGIIPISHTQDTAGPMTRTVKDAAYLLSALAGPDPRDPASAASAAHLLDYTKFLNPDGLRGARLGIARKFFGQNPLGDRITEEAIAVLKRAGAIVIDPADLPSHGKFGDAELEVLLFEFKYGLNKYFETTAATNKVRTLTDLIAFNTANASRELTYFEQDVLETADKKGPLTDKTYVEALEKCRKLSRNEGIDAVIKEHKVEAIVAMTNGPACYIDTVNRDSDTGGCSQPAAVSGYPHITVPAGYARGLPVGLSFFGTAWSEPRLIELAYAFEQATKARKAPSFPATVSS